MEDSISPFREKGPKPNIARSQAAFLAAPNRPEGPDTAPKGVVGIANNFSGCMRRYLQTKTFRGWNHMASEKEKKKKVFPGILNF